MIILKNKISKKNSIISTKLKKLAPINRPKSPPIFETKSIVVVLTNFDKKNLYKILLLF